MPEQNIREVFKQAYNNFDNRPLFGETLSNFYVDDFTNNAVESIKDRIDISKKDAKILVIGHRGCGKSTILNKVAEELQNDFHIVSFSVSDTLNMNDVEAIDLLISLYLQILTSMKDNKIDVPLSRFEDIMKSVKKVLKLNEIGINLLGTLSFKIKVELESRNALRTEFKNQIEELNNSITNCIQQIEQHYRKENKGNKEVLIIIDDLDKLKSELADKIFFEGVDIVIMPEAKIIYTFPLETYYCEPFMTVRDLYEDQFISLVVVDQEKNDDIGIKQLEKMVFKRINQKYITEEALQKMILLSGGLLRDLMKFMQDACRKARLKKSKTINIDIATEVINETANHYKRLFDFPNYKQDAARIAHTKTKDDVENKKLIYLLTNLFVLEYRLNDDWWYDVHPCLNQVFSNMNEND
jgi:nucleoside-triphosphatase THEP1